MRKINLRQKLYRFQYFTQVEIWQVQTERLSRWGAFFMKSLKIILLVIRGYNDDKISLRASALTFLSLSSIVPVIAMAFGISKGFGLESVLENQLKKALPGQEMVTSQIVSYATSTLKGTQGGLIAGIGMIVLLYTIMRLMESIEDALNHIWKVNKQRTLTRKFSDYISIMLFAPILVIVSSSATVFITTQIKHITSNIEMLKVFSPLILFFLKLFPYTLIWLLFIMLYMIMPNTKVKISSAVVAGIVAGTIYQIVQWGYITFQVTVFSKYNAIYGSLAALPLFLIWLQISWFIILIGAEISAAFQNLDKQGVRDETLRMSMDFRRQLSLLITQLVVKNFVAGNPPITITEISDTLRVPMRFVKETSRDLKACRILCVTHLKGEKKVFGYQPAQDTDRITISMVLELIEKHGSQTPIELASPEMKSIAQTLTSFKESLKEHPENKLIKDI